MEIALRYFASLREALDMAEERVTVPDSVTSVGDVREWLRLRGDVWATALAPSRPLRMACNHEMTDASTPITAGCEVAFFPPVTGG